MNTGNLEVNQRLQDRMITAFGNLSASNDPTQIPNDANDVLTKGAAAFALGRNRGLSDEQSMTAVEEGIKLGMTPEQAIREVSRTQRAQVRAALGASVEVDPLAQLKQAAAQIGNVASGDTNLTNTRYQESFDTVLGAPASMLEEDQTLGKNDRAYVSVDDQQLRDASTAKDIEKDEFRRALYEETRKRMGKRVFKNQPTTLTWHPRADKGGMDTPDQSELGSDRNPFAPSDPTQLIADQIRERNDSELLRFDERLRLAPGQGRANFNELADQVGVTNQYYPGTADYSGVNLQRSFETGGAFPTAPIVVGQGGEINLGAASQELSLAEVYDGVYVDPRSGAPVEVYEPASSTVAGINSPDSSQMLNAPNNNNAVEYVSKQAEVGTQFTRDVPYPQVAIADTLGSLESKLSSLPDRKKGFSRVRGQTPASIETPSDLQKAVDAVVRVGRASKQKFGAIEGGQRVTDREPGIAEALDALGVKGDRAREDISLALAARGGKRGSGYDTSGMTIASGSGDRSVLPQRSERPAPVIMGVRPSTDADRALATRKGVAAPSRSFEGRPTLFPASLPRAFDYGASSVSRLPAGAKNTFRQELARRGESGQISPEAAAPFMGSSTERGTRPTIRALGNADDIAAASRLERLGRVFPPKSEKDPGLIVRAANYLKSSGRNTNPTFGDAMDFLEEQYQTRVASGSVPDSKVIDEDELSGAIRRRQQVEENAAMDRLLRGPLRPGRV